VEYFRHKFTRACEIERQDKMKQWYDKDAMIREFMPGEKVFVLLFIHCLPSCFKDNNKASLFCSIVDYFFLIFVKVLRKNSNSADICHINLMGAKLHQHLHH
jgi:hypothetical protein